MLFSNMPPIYALQNTWPYLRGSLSGAVFVTQSATKTENITKTWSHNHALSYIWWNVSDPWFVPCSMIPWLSLVHNFYYFLSPSYTDTTSSTTTASSSKSSYGKYKNINAVISRMMLHSYGWLLISRKGKYYPQFFSSLLRSGSIGQLWMQAR